MNKIYKLVTTVYVGEILVSSTTTQMETPEGSPINNILLSLMTGHLQTMQTELDTLKREMKRKDE